MMARKIYLGDGVYSEIDARGLILTTENGLAITATIVLEDAVLEALLNYLEREKILTWEPHK